jgi:DNA mismatch endonuclease (patch repair protein)
VPEYLSIILLEEGYTVLRFWEHEIEKDPEKCLQKIIKIIKEARKQNSTKNS